MLVIIYHHHPPHSLASKFNFFGALGRFHVRVLPLVGLLHFDQPCHPVYLEGKILHNCLVVRLGGEGQGNLACCRPRGREESDTTEQEYNNEVVRCCQDSGG